MRYDGIEAYDAADEPSFWRLLLVAVACTSPLWLLVLVEEIATCQG